MATSRPVPRGAVAVGLRCSPGARIPGGTSGTRVPRAGARCRPGPSGACLPLRNWARGGRFTPRLKCVWKLLGWVVCEGSPALGFHPGGPQSQDKLGSISSQNPREPARGPQTCSRTWLCAARPLPHQPPLCQCSRPGWGPRSMPAPGEWGPLRWMGVDRTPSPAGGTVGDRARAHCSMLP